MQLNVVAKTFKIEPLESNFFQKSHPLEFIENLRPAPFGRLIGRVSIVELHRLRTVDEPSEEVVACVVIPIQ